MMESGGVSHGESGRGERRRERGGMNEVKCSIGLWVRVS